jgi:hypothetical protein
MMLYKRQIKKTNLVSENRNLCFNMKNSVGVEHWCFLCFMIIKKERDADFRLFRQMGILLRGPLLRFASL